MSERLQRVEFERKFEVVHFDFQSREVTDSAPTKETNGDMYPLRRFSVWRGDEMVWSELVWPFKRFRLEATGAYKENPHYNEERQEAAIDADVILALVRTRISLPSEKEMQRAINRDRKRRTKYR